jgi:HEAT repeat protein
MHTPDASSVEAVVKSIIKPGMTSEQKALAIWEYCWKNTWHWPAPKEHRRKMHETDVVFDAGKQLNVYGYSYCFAIRSLGEALYEAAGMEARSGGISGHVIPEVYYDGKWHFLDHDQRGFSRLSDGSIASLEDYGGGRGRELVLKPKRPSRPFFPAVLRPRMVYEQKHIFTGYTLNQQVHYRQHDKYRTAHSMNLALLPGMRFTRSWDSVGKWHCPPGYAGEVKAVGYSDPWKGPVELIADLFRESRKLDDGSPLRPGNGLLVYRPNLAPDETDFERGVFARENVDRSGQGFGPARAGRPCRADFRIRLPYVIAGWPGDVEKLDDTAGAAVVSGKAYRRTKRDAVRVLLSADGGASWTKIWEAAGTGAQEFAVDFSNHVEGKYSYVIRFELRGAKKARDARVLGFDLDTACQLNPAVLPAVRPGKNVMTVDFESGPEVFEEFVQYHERQDHERLLVSTHNVKILKGSYPMLSPLGPSKRGHVVYAMRAPKGRRIRWAKVGGAFRSHWDVAAAPDEEVRIYYSLDRPGKWKLLWEADRAPYLGHWCYETDQVIPLRRPAKAVFVKYELVRSRKGGNGGRLVGARMAWGCERDRRRAVSGAVRVTHSWKQGGKDRTLSRVVHRSGESYSFEAGRGKVRNLSLSVELDGAGPTSRGPHPLMLKRPKIVKRLIADPKKVPAMVSDLARLDRSPKAETAIELMWKSRHPLVQQTAAAALLAIGGEKAREALRKAIGKRSRAEQCYLDLLVIEGPTRELSARLKKSGANQRRRAADLLAQRGDPGAAGALRKAIAAEKSRRALAAEARALVLCAGREAAAEVEALLPRMPERDRIRTAGALAALGSTAGLRALSESLGSKNKYVRFEAAEQLAKCGRAEAEPLLLRALRDRSQWARRAAISGLGRVGGRKSLAALTRAQKRDPRADLRAEAAWALTEIARRLRKSKSAARRHK